ncbi:MAG: cobalamin-independent methionine synthase II family protein [Solirubrobacterales bacterium]|nr:cobalamin-independent methionine synthase II family protein [Solirubrobacterales bacterium]
MQIRGEEVLLPTSTVGALPRPQWLRGRVFGTLNEPVYRSHDLRVTYEDAIKLCCYEQEKAGLDILTDGHQYYEWEAPGFQLEPIFHFVPENLGGFELYGPPGDGQKYRPFYKPVVSGPIHWVRPMFEGVVYALQNATEKPFKFSLLGPAQQSVIVHDEHYGGDQVAMATDIAKALNQELRYLQDMGLEAVQLIDVLPPYTQDTWQIDVQNAMFEGITMTKIWHVCYGSVDGQIDVWENKAVDMMPLFHQSSADVIHLEFTHRDFAEIGAFREFPTDKVLGIGVIDSKDTQVESPEVVADRIHKAIDVVPAERMIVMTDCGLGYFSRTMAYAKLKAMCDGRDQVVKEISGSSAPEPVGAA